MKTTVLAGSAAAVMPKKIFSYRKKAKVKLGFIGTGLRGQWMLWLATKYPEIEISALCDIDDGMVESALKIIKDGWETEAIPKDANKFGKKPTFFDKIFRYKA